MASPARILVVAHRTAATPKLLERVRTRANQGPCSFVLLVPVSDALSGSRFDEVIISTLPHRVSHWLRLDLPARIERLGVPVTVVTAEQSERAWEP